MDRRSPQGRVQVALACPECGTRNYVTSKNRTKHPEPIERKKFCPECDTHTMHRETR